MRFVAMKLHTKDQAPKEGEREAAANSWAEVRTQEVCERARVRERKNAPIPTTTLTTPPPPSTSRPAPPSVQWKPTRAGYLRFLSESLAVYEALEEAVAANPLYAPFRATGLERAAALRADIAWFEATYGLTPPPLDPAGPGCTYARLVKQLASTDPPAFICHFYNTYFAHTAGGRMIGAKLSASLLDGAALAFYSYDGDFRPLLDAVRARIDDAAAGWSRADKDRCLDETAASFKNSGALLRLIAEPPKQAEA